MKKAILLFLIILANSSCGKSEQDQADLNHLDQNLTDGSLLDTATGLPLGALSFDAQLELFNFETEQTEKMDKAIEIIKVVVATTEFRNRILNHTYDGKTTFVDNGGYTNAQIYQKILEGAEALQPTRNNSLDAEIELYYADTNIVGHTFPHSKRIWVNSKYFMNYSAAGVAHNLFHEWMHKLGFNHSSTWSASRDFTVPYAVGNMIGVLGKTFYNKKESSRN